MTRRTKRARKPPLTEAEWAIVFRARCKSKEGRGDTITKEERKLVDRAYKEDPDRYGAMDADVFNATVPFGSNVRWRR